MKSLALVILAGRDQNNLTRCLDSVKSLSEKPNELIIVFDKKNSGDINCEVDIDELEVKLIDYNGQGYQPHMRNIAIQATEADYLWFVDDDVSLDENSCTELKRLINSIAENESIGAIAGRIIEDAKFDMSKFKKPIFLSFFRGAVGYFNWDYNQFPKTKYEKIKLDGLGSAFVVPFVQGTNMIFSRRLCLAVGGFDEDLGFGYSSYEDSEICFALSKKGFNTIYYPEVTLTHHKLPRVAGASRGYKDFNYATSLMRNYTISLLKNKYPSKILSYIYLYVFALLHPLRVYKYSDKTLTSLFHSFNSVAKGFIMGKTVVKHMERKRNGINNSLDWGDTNF